MPPPAVAKDSGTYPRTVYNRVVKALVYLLLPIVSLAGDTQALLDLARSAPAEFAADSLIRIAALPQTPKVKQLDLLQQAFEYGGMAQHPYKSPAWGAPPPSLIAPTSRNWMR